MRSRQLTAGLSELGRERLLELAPWAFLQSLAPPSRRHWGTFLSVPRLQLQPPKGRRLRTRAETCRIIMSTWYGKASLITLIVSSTPYQSCNMGEEALKKNDSTEKCRGCLIHPPEVTVEGERVSELTGPPEHCSTGKELVVYSSTSDSQKEAMEPILELCWNSDWAG